MPTEYFEQRERALLGERFDALYAAPQETAERGVTVSALRTTPEQFAAVAAPYIRQTVKNPTIDPAQIAPLLQQRCEVLTDIPEKVDFFDALPEYDIALYTNKKSKTDPAVSLEMLKTVRPLLAELPAWDDETLLAAMKDLAERLEVKNAKVMWPVRIAVSGRAVTPGGAVEICRILGRDETLRRIDVGIAKLEG